MKDVGELEGDEAFSAQVSGVCPALYKQSGTLEHKMTDV